MAKSMWTAGDTGCDHSLPSVPVQSAARQPGVSSDSTCRCHTVTSYKQKQTRCFLQQTWNRFNLFFMESWSFAYRTSQCSILYSQPDDKTTTRQTDAAGVAAPTGDCVLKDPLWAAPTSTGLIQLDTDLFIFYCKVWQKSDTKIWSSSEQVKQKTLHITFWKVTGTNLHPVSVLS